MRSARGAAAADRRRLRAADQGADHYDPAIRAAAARVAGARRQARWRHPHQRDQRFEPRGLLRVHESPGDIREDRAVQALMEQLKFYAR
jgi:hypothetical protein